jgi:hypothetical protein
VQGNPGQALVISNASAQFAQPVFSYSGQAGGYGTNAQTSTGIVLNSTTNGVAATQAILWTSLANPMISTLATAINAVSGWKALSDSVLGLWPVSELDGGYAGQGCATGATPSDGAILSVLQDLAPGSWSMDARRMGFMYVGQQFAGNTDAGRWGPGGYEMFGGGGYGGPSNQIQMGRVKVTYTAGESTIPIDVQHLVARLVKWKWSLMKEDLLLHSENAADYSYVLADQMVSAMPPDIRQGLASWALRRA